MAALLKTAQTRQLLRLVNLFQITFAEYLLIVVLKTLEKHLWKNTFSWQCGWWQQELEAQKCF